MTAPIREDARERVREATDIVQLIGERVTLRRAGRSYKGLCPFHSEKTPSFTVTPDRQIWHCFGCNKGGDVFAFLMEAEKVTFPEALRALADRAGIELPQRERATADPRFDRIYQANALARDFFRASFHAEAAAHARAYIASRGFEEPWLTRFEVGWAPEGWDGLLTALGKLLPAVVLEEAGLIVRRGDGSGHYDRFRNRILFPVATAAGKIAGFGARAIVDTDTPKYLNSPETPVFRKGRLLYGLPIARGAIRERGEAIVAEGYLDVMRLHAAGFTNAVSTCGTALTPDQARLLARLKVDVLLLYDGDDAGVRAADRALDPMLEAGLGCRILLLPKGEDPDSFIRTQGAQALRDRLDSALDVPGFLSESKMGEASTNPTVELRVRRLVELLGRVADPIRRRLLLRRGAEAFGLEETVLLEALKNRRGPRDRSPEREAAPGRTSGGAVVSAAAGGASVPGSGAGDGPAGASADVGASARAAAQAASADPIERELCARAVTDEGAFTEVMEAGGVALFRSEPLRELLGPWIKERRLPRTDELDRLLLEMPLARSLISELAHEPGRTLEASRREAQDLIHRLEDRRLKATIQALDRAIRDAERSRDEDSLGRLIAQRRDLASKLHTRAPSAIS